MIGADFKSATRMFFDRKAVMKYADARTRRVFSRFGAFVRRSAKSSIRKRKRPAPPNQPPSSHTGLLKKFIFFGFDPAKRSVVIGPVRLSQRGRGEAPSILEHGGLAVLRRRGGRKRIRYEPRPFMTPAMQKELPKLPAIWAASVK